MVHLIDTVCREVYTSPRFLPCHHTFCLPCLEELAKRHGDTIPCPTCRAPATVPPGGVCDLQVNFYFTDEALEQARREARSSMCPAHPNEVALLYCKQCKQAVCLRCKLTKHEGHVTEELSETAARCKKSIEEKIYCLMDTIKQEKNKLESCKENEKRAQEKQGAIKEQIQVRYDIIVAMAGKYRDEALQNLQDTSDDLQKELGADTQRVQGELSSLLQLLNRAQHALTSACDTEVLQVEREMEQQEGCDKERRKLEAVHSDQSYRPVLHSDFTNDIEDCIQTFIGTPVKLKFPVDKTIEIIRDGRCGDGECQEVHALRQREDRSVDVYYGGAGGDYSREKCAVLSCNGSIDIGKEYGKRVSCVSHKNQIWTWNNSSCNLGSKSKRMFSFIQNCATGRCYICSLKIKQENGKEAYLAGIPLIYPKVSRAHNFDSNSDGTFFALVDEDEDENSNDESKEKHEKKVDNRCSRVVRLYSNKSGEPIGTYTTENFFPTDVCFCSSDVLLIADWMNDCVHVTKVSDSGIEFIDYLPGSGDMVRPTALNLDLDGQLLIGCGDGWVLRVPTDICQLFSDRQPRQ
ncbi:tripartite motif-containing protein 2-like isoform X2 [Pomacea canaliculata]|uniref:tripartite motif-containing protein 2-like isoform X2 n=1 Tax=Pomacea canaliculata TaxID=400727 RepID=UPI000D725D50|nr:tripartite motif-containing protein 2-like isoform X2 [Pomacea canaliculata]